MSSLKLGRLPGHVPTGLRELSHYAAGPLPKAPAAMAPPAVGAWQMLGNQSYGDCGVAGLQHVFMADAADLGAAEAFPTEAQAISYYLDYTGGQDSGVVLADYLAHVHSRGYYGHTVVGYAPVAVHDVPTVHFAVWAYDAAYTGIVVTEAMQQAFAAGQPWTVQTSDGPILGGHCIPIVGYDDQYLTAVTWGRTQQISYAAWHYLAQEAWAVITGELADGDGHGVSLPALQADLSQLKG